MTMDNDEHEQEPRRGGRERKVVQRFEPGGDAGQSPTEDEWTSQLTRLQPGGKLLGKAQMSGEAMR